MPIHEAIRLALAAVWNAKLRSLFTVLGIVVSVGFLVIVVAIIGGMNRYVTDNLTSALIGSNAFQVRRVPSSTALASDDELRAIYRRPLVSEADAEAVRAALPEALAVSYQSGWPTPVSKVSHRNRDLPDILIFGVSPEYQIVQDYRITAGAPLLQLDVSERRQVAVIGFEVADSLFGEPARAIGRPIRIAGRQFTVKGVIATKGRVLGQSFDSFVLLPISTFEAIYGRRQTTTVSIKLTDARDIPKAMHRAEEAMRVAHRLRPGTPNDFSVDKADGLVAFWAQLTQVIFTVIPAVVGIGIVVGGIVIMNIMLMSVTERTREIGLRLALGARRRDIRRQFLFESVVLSIVGGIIGVAAGWLLVATVATYSPLPAVVTGWSVATALLLGAGTGILFGVYPAARAAQLDPITALRQE
jgi:putative ABC transport system permease protein